LRICAQSKAAATRPSGVHRVRWVWSARRSARNSWTRRSDAAARSPIPGGAGLLLSRTAVGALLGAAGYGTVAWRVPPARRLLLGRWRTRLR